MPSMKIEPCVSKPRMKIESPVAVLPFSPSRNVTPGVLRNACDSDVAPCWFSTSLLTTAIVCGVSSSGCVNFGDETRSTFGVASLPAPATETFGRVFGSSVGRASAHCAAAAASARLTATAIRRRAKPSTPEAGIMDRHGWLPNAVCSLPRGSGYPGREWLASLRGDCWNGDRPASIGPHLIANHSCLQCE